MNGPAAHLTTHPSPRWNPTNNHGHWGPARSYVGVRYRRRGRVEALVKGRGVAKRTGRDSRSLRTLVHSRNLEIPTEAQE